ncbi:superoxide dismutase family protein [Rhodococcus sp. NPDC058505]|uniref:superoxide dismutase[Cu-Zn] n=1 Tax=unclassified Rhodococcus (in: high G+C Gram-positive bacteria) TaxID=192944 RepID=UPI00365333EE
MALLTRRDSQTTRSRRVSLRVVAPMVAIAAVGLTACSPPNEVASDVQGTTPAVWTGAPAPEGDAGEGHGAEHADRLNTVLKGADGKAAGTATFVGSGENVVVTVAANGLEPGFHGLHIHSVGSCEGDFVSAGGHLQVEGHGGNPASGDLPSLFVRADGTANLTTTTDAFTIEDLQNHGEGTAIVVHAGADNFANIPTRYAPAPDQATLDTGDAGARVACGVIK